MFSMKRLRATTVLLGVLVVVFLVPVGLLFAGGMVLILRRLHHGIVAGNGGFTFAFRPLKINLLLVLIVGLAAFISWLSQKILRRQNSRR